MRSSLFACSISSRLRRTISRLLERINTSRDHGGSRNAGFTPYAMHSAESICTVALRFGLLFRMADRLGLGRFTAFAISASFFASPRVTISAHACRNLSFTVSSAAYLLLFVRGIGHSNYVDATNEGSEE